MHVSVAVSQVCPIVQAVSSSAVHWTHTLVVVLQAGVLALHAVPLVAVHWTQLFVVVLQAGVEPLQSMSDVHSTHVFVVVLHAGVEPVQSMSEVHSTHVSVLVSHAGVPPLHLLKLVAVHSTQVKVVALHAGVDPEQSASDVHSTQSDVDAPSPEQTPLAHGWFGLLSPAGSTAHVPSIPPRSQELHVPMHAALQQTPSTQKSSMH
jgi:hypothetical protein